MDLLMLRDMFLCLTYLVGDCTLLFLKKKTERFKSAPKGSSFRKNGRSTSVVPRPSKRVNVVDFMGLIAVYDGLVSK